jgi:hypothetical protein
MNKIKIICELARASGYDYDTKEQYRRLALSFLRSVAKDLQLEKGSYEIRFNPGGIAVAGDAILHHNNFYLHFSDSGAYWRTCEGRKDYTGGRNRWVCGFGICLNRETLVGEIKAILG